MSIDDLFSDLLNETKGFKYQVTVKVLLKNGNSMEKLNLLHFILIRSQKVINHRFRLENYFQEILYMIDVQISNGSS